MSLISDIGKTILQRHGFFSIDQIAKAVKLPRKKCRDTLFIFCKEGVIRQIKKGRKEHVFGKPPTYSMIYRVIDRKRLAARIAPKRFERTVQDKMWFIIWNKFKNNGSFNLHDLTVLAGAEKGTARWYLKALRRAGYIYPSRNGGGLGIEWRLTGNFGPERPFLDFSRKRKGGEI